MGRDLIPELSIEEALQIRDWRVEGYTWKRISTLVHNSMYSLIPEEDSRVGRLLGECAAETLKEEFSRFPWN